jgi:hypothetical protein
MPKRNPVVIDIRFTGREDLLRKIIQCRVDGYLGVKVVGLREPSVAIVEYDPRIVKGLYLSVKKIAEALGIDISKPSEEKPERSWASKQAALTQANREFKSGVVILRTGSTEAYRQRHDEEVSEHRANIRHETYQPDYKTPQSYMVK